MAAAAKPQSAYGSAFKQMKGTWDKLKGQSAQGTMDVPPGDYIAKLKTIKPHFYDEKGEKGQPTGRKIPGALAQFTVLAGEYTGETAPWFPKVPPDDDEALLRFMRDLRRLGADIDNIDLDQPGALEAEFVRLTAAKPAVKITRRKGDRGESVFTNIVALLSEDAVAQLAGESGGGEVVIEEPSMDGGIEVEEPTVEVEPTPAPVKAAPKPAAAKTAPKAAPAPVAAPAATRPAKTAPKPAPVTAVEEPEIEIEVGGDEPEPEPIEEISEEPTIDIGKRVQFKMQGSMHFGLVKSRDDAKSAWIVRDESSSKNLLIRYDLPSLGLAE